MGQTPFRVNDDPEISQPDAEYDPELGQSDPIICQVCGKLTDFQGHPWTGMEFGPNKTLSGSSLTRVLLECGSYGTVLREVWPIHQPVRAVCQMLANHQWSNASWCYRMGGGLTPYRASTKCIFFDWHLYFLRNWNKKRWESSCNQAWRIN